MVMVEFRVLGNLRFLSHAETVRVFQRACVRAGIKVLYSKGFNPRPKLSLPLPRSVGVEADDDVLCLQIEESTGTGEHGGASESDGLCNSVKTALSEQLPDGFELLSVKMAKGKSSIQPRLAVYLLAVREEYLNEELRSRIKNLPASENLEISRRTEPESAGFKNINVRPFLKSIELDSTGIAVECEISPAGTIRVDEILKLLGLDYGMLSAPVRRTKVQWQES
jgi:radical SAM-linked protein